MVIEIADVVTWAQETLAGVPLSGDNEPDDVSIFTGNVVIVAYDGRRYQIALEVTELS